MRKLLLGQLYGLYKQLPLPAGLLIVFLMVCLACLCAVCQSSAGQTSDQTLDQALVREMEARAVLAQGEKLIEMARPGEAILLFEEIKRDYPKSLMAACAEFRIAQCDICKGDYDNALERAGKIAALHKGKLLACWAQTCTGEALLRKGNEAGAIRVFRGVDDQLPDKRDFGPVDCARAHLGRMCEQYLQRGCDPLAASERLGVSTADAASRAEMFAILAAHAGGQGRIDLANPILARLSSECPTQEDELAWATVKVAAGYLKTHECKGDFAEAAAQMLEPIANSEEKDNDIVVQAALWAAKHSAKNDKVEEAIELLESVRSRSLHTAHGDQALYELGLVLRAEGRFQEAEKAFEELIEKKPFSTYVAQAQHLVERTLSSAKVPSILALVKEAEQNWVPHWQGLAFIPSSQPLDDPTILARQAVAMAKVDRSHEALKILDNLSELVPGKEKDLNRAKCEVLLGSLREAVSHGTFSYESVLILQTLADKCDAAAGREVFQGARNEAVGISLALMSSAARDEERAAAGCWVAGIYRRSERLRDAIKLLQRVLNLPDISSDCRARTLYMLGTCYRGIGYKDSARLCMSRVARRHPSSVYAGLATRQLAAWQHLEEAVEHQVAR